MNRPSIYDTDTLARLAERAGSHFFDASALRFFSSRVHAPVYGNRFFVTSEQDHGSYDGRYPAQPRLYTVREFKFSTITRADGRIVDAVTIDTVGKFQAYETREQAHRIARKLGEWAGPYAGGAPYPATPYRGTMPAGVAAILDGVNA